MRIGLASYKCKNKDMAFNIRQIEKAMKAARDKADALCFGEAFLQGFDSLCWDYDIDKNMAVPADSPTMRRLAELTKTYGMALMVGYIEKTQEALYSSYVVLDGGKTVHNYRRISKGWKEYWKTDEHYKEGNTVAAFTLRGTSMTTALCGDLWDFPERFKTEHLLIWPVYVNFSPAEWERAELSAYAKQAEAVSDHVLMINPLDDDPACYGGSCYFSKGKIIERLPFGEEGILFVDTGIDLTENETNATIMTSSKKEKST